MAFIGKTYTFSRNENFEAYLNSLTIPEAIHKALLNSSPSYRLDKNDDGSYTLHVISPEYNKQIRFNLNEEFEETSVTGQVSKTTFTLEGNKLTQVQKYNNGTLTLTREFGDTELKTTLTNSAWDGVAYRYYKA